MRILVATDGSRGGCAAVKFAGRLASRDSGTELIILTVGIPPRAGKGTGAPAPNPGSAKTKIGGVEPTYRFVPARSGDSIPETISREAERLKVDLVVIGSEGRDTLSEWVVGGVALRLIYVARRPVTVVRPPRRRKTAIAV
jgi:nucleotide-binding universal stress UspA family protein